MSRRLHEELSFPKHGNLMKELNEMSIRIKLHLTDVSDESASQQAAILEARKNHPNPTPEEIVGLLERCYREMDQCREPFIKR